MGRFISVMLTQTLLNLQPRLQPFKIFEYWSPGSFLRQKNAKKKKKSPGIAVSSKKEKFQILTQQNFFHHTERKTEIHHIGVMRTEQQKFSLSRYIFD